MTKRPKSDQPLRTEAAHLPWGTAAWLPEDCVRLRGCEGALRDLFLAAGAGEIAMPSLEYAEVLERGFGHPEKLFRIVDFDGRLLALRPELTTPAARLYATALKKRPLPLKIFYIGQVYRQEAKHRGLWREFRQAGFECYGGDPVTADVVVIRLASEALARLEQKEAVICVGHVGIAESLMDEHGLAGTSRADVKAAMARKDRSTLAALEAPGVFAELINLPGNASAFENAATLSSSAGFRAATANLREVSERLSELSHNVVLDFSAIRPIDYYTGIVFEGLLADRGRPVLSGGRYDRLVEQFGPSTPATGFSVELEALLR
jgi:ATP phosphoribosyltransferase regulatory subunit